MNGIALQALYGVRFLAQVLPRAGQELARWRARAAAIPDGELRRQALASLTHKAFHAEGGSVYACLGGTRAGDLVRAVVALQTISDYLDNLCDRGPTLARGAYRRLHGAMLAAVDLGRPLADFYTLYPRCADGGYLPALAAACRRSLRGLPGYGAVRPALVRLVSLYNDLQVYKHGPAPDRERRLAAWFRREGRGLPSLYWNEFAAACGSTLAVFALLAEAARGRPRPREVERLLAAYFPWVCGLHILLDYWIDQEEDRRGGDLNLVACYPAPGLAARRLAFFLHEAARRVGALPAAPFHRMVVHGLPALYLSDPKVRREGRLPQALALLAGGGPVSGLWFALCHLRRRLHPGLRRAAVYQEGRGPA